MTTIPILDLESAKSSILSRRRIGGDYPPALLEGLERRFGAQITPEQAVARIVEDIRVGGDGALARWTAALDGVEAIDPPPALQHRAGRGLSRIRKDAPPGPSRSVGMRLRRVT